MFEEEGQGIGVYRLRAYGPDGKLIDCWGTGELYRDVERDSVSTPKDWGDDD